MKIFYQVMFVILLIALTMGYLLFHRDHIVKKVPVLKTKIIKLTPSPIPSFFRGFSSSPILEHPSPTAGQSAQPSYNTTNNYNTPTSSPQAPTATPAPQPTPMPTCRLSVVGLCI